MATLGFDPHSGHWVVGRGKNAKKCERMRCGKPCTIWCHQICFFFQGKIIYSRGIFPCHVWLLEGNKLDHQFYEKWVVQSVPECEFWHGFTPLPETHETKRFLPWNVESWATAEADQRSIEKHSQVVIKTQWVSKIPYSSIFWCGIHPMP